MMAEMVQRLAFSGWFRRHALIPGGDRLEPLSSRLVSQEQHQPL